MTYAEATEIYTATTDWYGDRDMALHRKRAIDFILLDRPSQAAHVGTSMQFETRALLSEREAIERFLTKTSKSRLSWTAARPRY